MKGAIAIGLLTCLTCTLMPASAQLLGQPGEDDVNLARLPVVDPGANPLGPGNGFKGKKRLNLSDEQLEKIYKLKNKLADDIGPKKLELQKLKRQMQDLLTQESIDRGAVQATQNKINAAKSDLANSMLAFKMDFNENLTAEQRKNLRYRQLKPRKRMRGHKRLRRMRRGQGHGHGPVIGQRPEFQPAGQFGSGPQGPGNLGPISDNL